MNERSIIAGALMDCKETMEYGQKRLDEIGNSNRTIRQHNKQMIEKASAKMDTIIELAYALGIIDEEESRMEPDMLIELIEIEG